MTTFEEVRAARPNVTFKVSAAAYRECGEGALSQAIRDQVKATDQKTVDGMRNALVDAWRKLTAKPEPITQIEEAAR